MVFCVREIEALRLLGWCQYIRPAQLLRVVSETELSNLLTMKLIKYHTKSKALILTAEGRLLAGTIEEHKKNGVVSYKEISPLDFYNTIYGSFDREYFLRSGLLPPNCLQVSFCGEDKYFVLWNPELRADISYGDTEYLDFPIPRMVFGIRTLRDGRAVDCAISDDVIIVGSVPDS